MFSNREKPLKVLSASAGSGKTYSLVMMYLKLILGDHQAPIPFASVMAMTFTNKAAAEMKSRIVEALNTLGTVDGTNIRSLQYLGEISRELGLKEEETQKRAKSVLKQILHQYENFNVLTIDKFNLRLIRSFSRDLNINTDFQTTTNEKDVLSQIVDQLFAEINQPDFEKLTQITLKFSKENMDEELKWDFKTELKALAEILIKEQNLQAVRDIMEQDFSLAAYDQLKKEIESIKTAVNREAKELHALFFRFDPLDFPGGTTTVKAFEKLISTDLFESNYEQYFSPSIVNYLTAEGKTKNLPEEIKQKGLAFVGLYEKHKTNYLELDKFRSNFFNIAILQLIAIERDNFKKSDNIVLISEFNKLVSDLLKNEEAPYIYERIGNRYKHFLLDEFQDTSRLQWLNLIPLIHESLSYRQANLIVGDPKQSIYRFKNGLAEQFVALPGIYNPEQDSGLNLKSQYFQHAGEIIPLEHNWRSKKEIVDFNNLFFKQFSEFESDLLHDFYKDVSQQAKGGEGAYIFIESELKAKKSKTASDEAETEDETGNLTYLLDWIRQCLDDGYDKGDICILGFTSKSCNTWATFLSNQGFKVVSADSLLLGADPQVKLLISYIKWRVNPIGELEARRFSEIYFDLKTGSAIKELKKFWKKIQLEEREILVFDTNKFIREEFGQEEEFFFRYENLYQLVQRFYLLVGFRELNHPYLHQFSDYAFQFDLNFGPDLSLFLENFNNEGYKIPVQVPENKDAVKIMTGHKSKGLEFPVVMVPSMNWNILNKKGKFLIQSKDYFFYTGISKSAKIPAIKSYYEREFAQAYLDKINLNYVMFTRPQDRLYVKNFSSRMKSDSNYEEKVHAVLQSLPGISEEDAKIVYESGSRTKKTISAADSHEQKLDFNPRFIADNLWFPDISLQDRELLSDEQISEQRRYGNQLHETLANLDEISQLEKVLRALVLKGKLESAFTAKIKQDVRTIFALPAYRDLFANATELLREQTIIISGTESKRPDLIIIKENETLVLDYKTGLPDNKHQKQVAQYCKTLTNMAYPAVKGLIFYTAALELVEVA